MDFPQRVVACSAGIFVIPHQRANDVAAACALPRLIGASLCNVTAWNIWAALLSVALLHERLTPRRLLGLLLGMSGMLLLLSHEWTGLRTAAIGALLVVGAAASWALGGVMIKRFPTSLPTTSFTAWQMLLGGLPIVVGTCVLDSGKVAPLSWQAYAALAYNIVVAFIICYWVWFKIAFRSSLPLWEHWPFR